MRLKRATLKSEKTKPKLGGVMISFVDLKQFTTTWKRINKELSRSG